MIRDAIHDRGLAALQALLVHARLLAYESGDLALAALLDDMEVLPEFLGDAANGTDQFREMLAGIVEKRPELEYIIERFDTPSDQHRRS
jgi:hypothetical protein